MKGYIVWVQIEQFDDEKDKYEDVDHGRIPAKVAITESFDLAALVAEQIVDAGLAIADSNGIGNPNVSENASDEAWKPA